MAGATYAFVYLAVVAASLIGTADSLDCYVCRGCADVTSADVQTCAPSPPSTPAPEPTTDSDMNFDLPGNRAQMVTARLLDESEEEAGHSRSSFVLDNSKLPGDYLTRALKQYRADEDEARCVIAVYEESNGSPNVVRECSYASDNQETRCREAVGGNYAGNLLYCNLCEDDLCNSAAKSALALALIIVGVFLNVA